MQRMGLSDLIYSPAFRARLFNFILSIYVWIYISWGRLQDFKTSLLPNTSPDGVVCLEKQHADVQNYSGKIRKTFPKWNCRVLDWSGFAWLFWSFLFSSPHSQQKSLIGRDTRNKVESHYRKKGKKSKRRKEEQRIKKTQKDSSQLIPKL